MSSYKVATGFDVPSISLALIAPQCRSKGVQSTRRTPSIAGTVLDEGLYIRLEWNVIGTVALYQALLEQFGLDVASTAEVTISVPEYQFSYNRFNGIAVRPALGDSVTRDNFFIRDISILIKNLEYAA